MERFSLAYSTVNKSLKTAKTMDKLDVKRVLLAGTLRKDFTRFVPGLVVRAMIKGKKLKKKQFSSRSPISRTSYYEAIAVVTEKQSTKSRE